MCLLSSCSKINTVLTNHFHLFTDVKHIQRKRNRTCYPSQAPFAYRFMVDYFYSVFDEQGSDYSRHCSSDMVDHGYNCIWRSSSPSFSYGFLQRDRSGVFYIEICPPSKYLCMISKLLCECNCSSCIVGKDHDYVLTLRKHAHAVYRDF